MPAEPLNVFECREVVLDFDFIALSTREIAFSFCHLYDLTQRQAIAFDSCRKVGRKQSSGPPH